MVDAAPLLSVRHLVTSVGSVEVTHPSRIALDDVSFEVGARRVLGIIGDSGSGKSLTALSILGLLPVGARVLSGEIVFDGQDLVIATERDMQRVRGRKIAMVFQEPATALSPVHTVAWHMATALRAVGQLRPGGWFRRALNEARPRAIELLGLVELPDPERLLDAYPHQLSAGMRRRVLIALALAGRPALLIADEPTTGLDAPIQSQIIDLFARLTRDFDMATILITHDLCALSEIATDIVVMSAGKVVEAGPASSLLRAPQHPYTAEVLAHLPNVLARQPRALACACSETPPQTSQSHAGRHATPRGEELEPHD